MAILNIMILVLSCLNFALSQIIPFDDWEHQKIVLDDVIIHFRYSGTGPPILFVHGFPQHSVGNVSSSLNFL